jgi:urease accessory protein
MGWQGHLRINYRREGERTTALDRHHGPLRVLQRLYPEGEAICHHVLVHPPGGIVGGDQLQIELGLEPGCHALVTTPSATRYYRSAGEPAGQRLTARLAPGSRLEWLPLETIAYSGCLAENHARFELAPGAEMMGWEMLALGLPAAGLAFERGCITQHLEVPGTWLDRGRIDAEDAVLLDSPLGLAGRKVLGTVWVATGEALSAARREALLEAARSVLGRHALNDWAGATAPGPQIVVCRALAGRVEPLFALWREVRAAWREVLWALPERPPRIWNC